MAGSPNFKEPATIGSWSPERSTWGRARKAFRQEAKEFCLFTGLHGYKYIVQPGKHRAERLFWILVVTVSLVAAVLLMMIAYDFNRSHPTILAVDTTHYPLWAVDAPGVTVCPSNKVLRSKARQLLKTMVLPADVSEEELLDELGLLVELIVPRSNNATKFARLQNILDKNSLSIDEVMRQVTPSCDDLLIRCIWKRRQCLHCSDIFRQVPTAYGYCCSFNYMDRDLDAYRPRMGGCVGVSYNQVQRLSACGYTNGLSVTVRIQPKEFLSSFLASHAVLVLIHNPTQYPDGNADLKIVGAGTVSFISYMAEVTLPSDRIATLKSSIRKCQFESETYLPMFRAYTYENCMASCQANRTMQKCGCVPVTYPHILQRKMCTLTDVPCIASLLTASGPTYEPFNATTCPLCRPLCENVEYQVETSVGVLRTSSIPEGDPLTSGLLGIEENYALFHVFANDLVTTKYKMDVYMTREDLLGSLGGLSGLLVGFSLVSGFEFVYFFTIRPFFRMRARRAASREESRTASAAQDAVKGLGNSASSITSGSPG
ncbi:sodium channel protein Nach-like, partial [Frankliniella occidentalis]|uniref:Sodium channel protein Nach-like n=1 Tax=Frankliniella occidentalis TaxID=133901 RepID=A0A9C6XAL3_FRAOC